MVKSERAKERLRKLFMENLQKRGLKDDLIQTMLEGDGVDISIASGQRDIDIDVLADEVIARLKQRGDLDGLGVAGDNDDDDGPDGDFFDDPGDVNVEYDTETSFDSGGLNEED